MNVYGKNVALEYLDSDKKINRIFLQDNFKDEKILNLIRKRNIIVKALSKYEMDRKCNSLHQGIILELEDYKYASLESLNVDNSLIVILDHITDPHNFGAIIRSCEAAGVNGIIIPGDRSIDVNATVMKTSVGTVSNMKIVKVTNLVNTIKKLKDEGFWVYGTDMNGTDYDKLDYSGKCAIICGSEGSGMSRLVRDNCDFIVSIPMQGNVNSLNASVATAIIVFEAVKIRKG